jgi:nitrate reductase NapAB chaperone NapD
MPVLGLVLILRDGAAGTRHRVAGQLATLPDVELGQASGHRWPAVIEAPTSAQAEARVEVLRGIRGVVAVETVYADFEDLLTRGVAQREGT